MTFSAAARGAGMRRARIIAVLAITQLIGWGTGYDMLGVLGRVVAADLHFSNEIAFLGVGAALIVSALVGPLVGKWLASQGATGLQDVMIFLSDGEANASQSQMASAAAWTSTTGASATGSTSEDASTASSHQG